MRNPFARDNFQEPAEARRYWIKGMALVVLISLLMLALELRAALYAMVICPVTFSYCCAVVCIPFRPNAFLPTLVVFRERIWILGATALVIMQETIVSGWVLSI